MVTVEQIGEIRHAYYNERHSIRWIAREYRRSRRVIRRALGDPEPRRYTRHKAKAAPMMDPWKPRIDALLAESETLPRKQRYTAKRIYDLLRAEGYGGCIGGVRHYVAKKRVGMRPRVQVYMPLTFDPGQDAQADWAEAEVELAGERITVPVFGMRLCYSRAMLLCAYPTQRQECLFDGHVRAFEFFGGVPGRISYDNLTTAVQAILAGHKRREQQAFAQFRSTYLFKAHFCTPGEGHEKGQVEHGLGFGRRNFMTPLIKAASYEDLNAQLLRACQADFTRTVDGQASSILDMLLHERPSLLQLPARPFACCVTTQATLTPYSQVVFETNRYSVPVDAAQRLLKRTLTVRAFPFTVEIIAGEGTLVDGGGPQILATHRRSYAQGEDVCDPQHYLSLLQQRPGAFEHAKPLRQWRETWPGVYNDLLQHLRGTHPDGAGVREFVRILKLHADHPAKQVEQAVKDALAHQRPTYDGVRLCLHLLEQPSRSVPPLDLTQQPHLAPKLTASTWSGLVQTDLVRYDALLMHEVAP